MKFNLNVDLKKLVRDMRGPKGAAALTEEFERLGSEWQKFKDEVKPQAQAKLKKAEAQYQVLVKTLQTAQKDFDKEVKQSVNVVKKQAKEVGKNLSQYKKMAVKQKSKIQAALAKPKKKAATTTKKKAATTKKRATKKAVTA